MKRPRIAVMVQDCKGEFSQWKVGECVKVLRDYGRHVLIERERWRGSRVHICNQCYGIPKKAIRYL